MPGGVRQLNVRSGADVIYITGIQGVCDDPMKPGAQIDNEIILSEHKPFL